MTKIIIYFSWILFLFLFPLQSIAADYDLNTLLNSNKAFQISGASWNEWLGWQIANAGDVNKDGFDDIIIGAPGTVGRYGRVYVIYGKAGSSFSNIDLHNLGSTVGFKITGSILGDYFGLSVGGAGDINGDGFADLVIGAPNSQQGVVYVIYGKANPVNIDISNLNPSAGFMIKGNSYGDQLGYSVAPVGDINKDGFDDIIIGAPYANSNRGGAYVIYGKQTGANINLGTTTLNPATTGITIKGNSGGDRLGYSVAPVGDINKDGFADIIIGAPNKFTEKGAAYVIYGQASPVHIDLQTALIPATTGFMIVGKSAGETFGISVGRAGDLNKDGFDDIIIGAAGRNSDQGAAQIIYGGSNSNIDLSTPLDPKTKGFVITGESSGNSFGLSVASAGDVNKDGYDDIIIGAPNKGYKKGAVYVIYGGETSTRVNIDLQIREPNPLVDGFTIVGTTSYRQFGLSVAPIDLNKDGNLELLVGAPQYSDAYVIFPGKMCSTNCVSCSKIATCDTCSSSYGVENSVCVVCSQGKYSSNGGPCTACPTGCNRCTSATYCQSCSTGYSRLSGTTICQPTNCPANCRTCSGSVCTLCEDGYSLDSSHICKPCSGGCKTCTISSCSDCMDGYTLSNGQCCPDQCSACTNYADCTSCQPGYVHIASGQCEPCSPGTFESGGSCQTCPSHCKECTNLSSCTACDSGYGLFNSLCEACHDGTYLATDGECKSCLNPCETCLDASTCKTCYSGKILHMFQCMDSCPDKTYLSSDGTYCADCQGECSKCSSLSVCTACETGFGLLNSQCLGACPDGTYLGGGLCESCPTGCSKCTSNSVCQECSEGYTLSPETFACNLNPPQEIEGPVKEREKAASGAFGGASVAGAALTSGSSLPINVGLVAKILRNLKYLNITVSAELQETFVSWKVNSGFLKAPKSWSQESHSKPLPGVFRRYGLEPVFLINYWKPLIMTLIGFVLFVSFKIMEIGLNKGRKNDITLANDSIPRRLNVVASNFALTQIYSSLDDVVFYFILDARSTEFDGAFRGFSFGLGLVLILLGSVILGFHGLLLKKYQNLKGDDKTQVNSSLQNFLYKYENMKLIFEDFKDTTLVTQSFLWIHLMRALISSLLFATLFEYPLVQTLILLTSTAGMIIFILVKSPFKDVLSVCSQLFGEIVVLLANICMLTLAILDQAGSENIDAIKHLSRGVIVLNVVLLFGSAILMVLGILKSLWNLYQARKKPRQAIPSQIKNSRTINNNADRFNSINQSENTLQQQTCPQEDFEYPRKSDFEPRQVYSGSPGDLNTMTNAQNRFEISDPSFDVGGENPNNIHFSPGSQGNYFEPYQLGTNASIDETVMNTSNTNLLRYNSLRPRRLGKIKMPGGIEINPRSNNTASPGLEFQNPYSLPYQNPRPANMENMGSSAGIESQLKSMGSPEMNNYQKRMTNKHEEFILERTRARMRYHHARKMASYK